MKMCSVFHLQGLNGVSINIYAMVALLLFRI